MSSHCVNSTIQDHWWNFLTASASMYVVGIALSLLIFLASWLSDKRTVQLVFTTQSLGLLSKIKMSIRQLISGDTIASCIFVFSTMICNLAYIALVLYRTQRPVYRCFPGAVPADVIVEAILSMFLILYFIVRFLATESIVWFWFRLYTVVDVFTLPHVFVTLGLGEDWLGLKSLRFVWLIQLIDFVRFLPFVRSQDSIDIMSLLIRFVSFWLTAAGIIHLLETSGDPWLGVSGDGWVQTSGGFNNSQSATYWEYVYFIMVTMSTVGYGDYFAMTTVGRIFMTFFILGGLAFFAIALPALVDITINFYHNRQYSQFDTRRVPQHVMVCGHITASTVEEFLNDFLHKDRGDKFIHVLFLHPSHPDADLKNVLRFYNARVQYLVGSVLNSRDLLRVKIHQVEACFILTDKRCKNPIEEDNGNLLRLVSIKNTTDKIPVIIQVLRAVSKEQISHIPGWHPHRDITICFSELKLGLLAQSCLCPGLSTLIANLFYTSDSTKAPKTWQELYNQGASNELYPAAFSPAFAGKKFHEAARECYERFGLILVAFSKTQTNRWYVNPSPGTHQDLVITGEMTGYFIGPDSRHVNRVSHYCSKCHSGDHRWRRVRTLKCSCKTVNLQEDVNGHRALVYMLRPFDEVESLSNNSKRKTLSKANSTEIRNIESCILQPEETQLTNHIVLCLFAEKDSPIVGLRNFFDPLRSQHIPDDEVKPVVIVTNRSFLEKEWEHICEFSNLHLVFGSPLNWATLQKAQIDSCSVCVILTAIESTEGREQAIDDKDVVLCTLSLKSHLNGQIMIITDLIQESNVQFLDISDEDEIGERMYKSQPFACGEAFAMSMFDSVTTAAYHSIGTLYLVETLIGTLSITNLNQSHIAPIRLSTSTYSQYIGGEFSALYIAFLEQHSVCLALYRQLEDTPKYYVITAPPPDTTIESNDIAFVLTQWGDDHQTH